MNGSNTDSKSRRTPSPSDATIRQRPEICHHPSRGGFNSRIKKPPQPCYDGENSPSWTRTSDNSINSRTLYQLSYRGSGNTEAYRLFHHCSTMTSAKLATIFRENWPGRLSFTLHRRSSAGERSANFAVSTSTTKPTKPTAPTPTAIAAEFGSNWSIPRRPCPIALRSIR